MTLILLGIKTRIVFTNLFQAESSKLLTGKTLNDDTSEKDDSQSIDMAIGKAVGFNKITKNGTGKVEIKLRVTHDNCAFIMKLLTS